MAGVNETPSLAQVIKDAIEARLFDLHTCLPAKIVSYDANKMKASVQPVLQRSYSNGKLVTMPIINDVPVLMPRAGKAFVSLPLKAGDAVTLVFSERSLDKWKSVGDVTSPDDPRKFHISDAYAFPGGYSFNSSAAADPNDVLVVNDKTEVRLKAGGKFAAKNLNTSDELVDLVHQMATLLETTTTNTIFGPMKLNDFAQFGVIKTKLANLKV